MRKPSRVVDRCSSRGRRDSTARIRWDRATGCGRRSRRSGSRVVQGTADSYAEEGWNGFRGTIVFPATGDWQVTINSGFGNARAVLVPWRVVDSVRTIRGTVEEHLATLGINRFSEVERGRRPPRAVPEGSVNLDLREKEILPLIAFLTAEPRAATR
jgi:hypothetical protein